ncbi:MAG: crossover junction endodeoxyribonuclease RuvC [Alistipes sp.]|nr:crossover junction endodeoxyribonuclease RuvC [Alistipes sp.]
MGIDPGTNFTGYGILEVEGRRVRAVVMGDIDLHRMDDPYEKLQYIFRRISAIISEYGPAEVALESPFFGANVQSMLKLGRAQGVAMAAALNQDRPVFEYAPSRIKQAITGSGSASKEQVAAIVRRMLSIKEQPKHLDDTDGMAVALCHYFTSSSPLNDALGEERVKGLGGDKKARKRGSVSWEKFLNDNPQREVKQLKPNNKKI